MADTAPALEFRGVFRSFADGERDITVLRDADLALEPGEQAALIGRSGSGKTTALRLAAGLDVVDAGEIRLTGQVLDATDAAQRAALRRQRLGVIFQHYNLVPTLTVTENLLLPQALKGWHPSPARARQWLDRLGLRRLGHRYPEALSGGEQQRVAVARALIHAPALILADEPTAALDEDNARIVIELLLETSAECGAALLLVSHRADLSARLSKQYVINAHRLCQIDS